MTRGGRRRAVTRPQLSGRRPSQEQQIANGVHHRQSLQNASESKETVIDSPFGTDMVVFSLLAALNFALLWPVESADEKIPSTYPEACLRRLLAAYRRRQFELPERPPLAALTAFGAESLLRLSDDATVLALRWATRLLGSFSVGAVYLLVVRFTSHRPAAVFSALLICFEPALLLQSQFSFADTLLPFCVLLQQLSLAHLGAHWFRVSAGSNWWRPLAVFVLTISLSVSAGLSFSGAVMAVFICLSCMYDSYKSLLNPSIPLLTVATGAAYRLIFTLVIPLLSYLFVFWCHLRLLNGVGPDAGYMSVQFQVGLTVCPVRCPRERVGRHLQGGGWSLAADDNWNVVRAGSQVTLRNADRSPPCWLHSHAALYPLRYADGRGSSYQQQVTCYEYKDVNNWWLVRAADSSAPLRQGGRLALVHGMTRRLLHSHDVAAPVLAAAQEVSCYVDHNVSMAAEPDWLLALDEDGPWRAARSTLRLTHERSGGRLRVSGRRLPLWAFGQLEVVADATKELVYDRWNVDEHHPFGLTRSRPIVWRARESLRLAEAQAGGQYERPPSRRLSFLQELLEIHRRIYLNQNSRTNETVLRNLFAISPVQFLLAESVDSFGNKDGPLYQIPNPAVACGILVSFIGFLVSAAWVLVAEQRAASVTTREMATRVRRILRFVLIYAVLWHLPHWFVDRPLFWADFTPVYFTLIIISGSFIGFLLQLPNLSPYLSHLLMSSLIVWLLIVLCFYACLRVILFNGESQVFAVVWRDYLHVMFSKM